MIKREGRGCEKKHVLKGCFEKKKSKRQEPLQEKDWKDEKEDEEEKGIKRDSQCRSLYFIFLLIFLFSSRFLILIDAVSGESFGE